MTRATRDPIAVKAWVTANRESKAAHALSIPVYFVQCGDKGLVKIGFTMNFPRRLAELQVSNPEPVRLIGWVRGGRREERRLHAKFAHLRQHAEWFNPGPVLLAYLQGITEQGEPPVIPNLVRAAFPDLIEEVTP